MLLTRPTSLTMYFLVILQEFNKSTVKLKVPKLLITASIKIIRATLKEFSLKFWMRCLIKTASGLNRSSIVHKVLLYGLHLNIGKSRLFQRLNTYKSKKLIMLNRLPQHTYQCSKANIKCLANMNSRFQKNKKVKRIPFFILKLILQMINIF